MISQHVINKKVEGLGIDIADAERFYGMKKTNFFLRKVFTARELEYCFSYRFPSSHLAGIFSAKEAVVKASGGRLPVWRVEVRHSVEGGPKVFVDGKFKKNFLVSISHNKVNSCAIALKV